MASKSSVNVATIPQDCLVWIPVGYKPPTATDFGFQIGPVQTPYLELLYQRPATSTDGFTNVHTLDVSKANSQNLGHLDMSSQTPARNTATKDVLKIPKSRDNMSSEGQFCRQEFKLPNCITSAPAKKRHAEDADDLQNNTLWTKTEAVKKKVQRFLLSVEREYSKGSLYGSDSLDKIVNHIETEFSTVLDSEPANLPNVPQMNWNFDLKLITNSDIFPYSVYNKNREKYSSISSDSSTCDKNMVEPYSTAEKYANEDIKTFPCKCKDEPNDVDLSAEIVSSSACSRNDLKFVTNSEKYRFWNISGETFDKSNIQGYLDDPQNPEPARSRSNTDRSDLSGASSRSDLSNKSSTSFHSWSNCSMTTQSSTSAVSLDSFIETSSGSNPVSNKIVSEKNVTISKPEVMSIVKDIPFSRRCLTESGPMSSSSKVSANRSQDINCRNWTGSGSNTSREHTDNALVRVTAIEVLDERNQMAKRTCPNIRNTARNDIRRAFLQCPSAPKKRTHPLNNGDMVSSGCIGSNVHLNQEEQGRKRVRRRLFEDERIASGDDDIFVIPIV